jgi:glycerol-3-phosphate acyltransferase PlsY
MVATLKRRATNKLLAAESRTLMNELLIVAIGYLVGSIPFAFLLSRRRGIDLRTVGSGNVGASNVLRTSGVPMAVAAMVLDALKGSLAVLVAVPMAFGPAAPVAAGLASVIGHIYPVWLGFKGGKGVATAAGVFGVLAPAALGIASAVFVLVVWTTRYISVGSVAGAVTLALAAAISDVPAPVAAGAMLTALVIIHRHRGNLSRLVAGTERRVGQRV